MGDITKLFDGEEIDYLQYVEDVEDQTNRDISEFRGEYQEWKQNRLLKKGDLLPWSKTNELVFLDEGEITVWHGYNGHFKTQAILMVCLWLAKADIKVHIASMEMEPVRLIERLARMASGVDNTTANYDDHLISFLTGKISIYDKLDKVGFDLIRGMVKHAATVRKCKHIIIDSLMMCGVSNQDYEGQSSFVGQLKALARKYHIHIHLIAHAKKPADSNEGKIPERYDISGHSDISNKVDRVIAIWMDKNKKRFEDTGYPPGMDQETIDEIKSKPDMKLSVQKQRNSEFEGIFSFWIHRPSGQLLPNGSFTRPMQYDIGFTSG